MTRLALNILLLSTTAAACGGTVAIQCDQSSTCDLEAGGICAVSANGNRWCSYPDPACPSGYRYSTFQVGDGLSGLCVPQPDAGMPSDSSTAAVAPSCVGLPATCGASGNDSCCNSPLVPGGTFFRSYDPVGDVDSGNKQFPATVSSFRLDKYEVTMERFRVFVMAGQGTQANPPVSGSGANPYVAGSGWDSAWNAKLPVNTSALMTALNCDSALATWNDSNSHRPINCITWYEAMAFCAWDGAFLPTETEWNYAATGGEQQRAYPWSTPASSLTVDPSHASYNDDTTCVGDGMPGCTITDIVPVGTKPQGDGRWGQSDLAGNVKEWVLDYWNSYPLPCTDCANLTPLAVASPPRMLRGGGFESETDFLRTANQDPFDPLTPFITDVGFRCARSASN